MSERARRKAALFRVDFGLTPGTRTDPDISWSTWATCYTSHRRLLASGLSPQGHLNAPALVLRAIESFSFSFTSSSTTSARAIGSRPVGTRCASRVTRVRSSVPTSWDASPAGHTAHSLLWTSRLPFSIGRVRIGAVGAIHIGRNYKDDIAVVPSEKC